MVVLPYHVQSSPVTVDINGKKKEIKKRKGLSASGDVGKLRRSENEKEKRAKRTIVHWFREIYHELLPQSTMGTAQKVTRARGGGACLRAAPAARAHTQ